MAFKLLVYTEDGSEYEGTDIFDTFEEAEEEVDSMFSNGTMLNGSMVEATRIIRA